MSHILKTIYKGWNYIVTFSTPLFGGYVVYDIQQIVFNKERQEKYSESRQSKPSNIEPSTTFSNIKNPTFDEKSNIKNHRDESQGLEKKKQQISNIPTASEKENKPTQTQNKIPPSKQPLYKGKSIMTNSTDESQQRLEENTQQRNIIPSTTEREKEPTNKQEQKIPSQQRLPEENKIIKEPPEFNTIPTTTEKETKPTQKQVETLTSKQPMSKGNQIIQKPTEDNDISAAKDQKENARKPFFKCKPYSTYIDLRKFNSIQTVTVCTGCPSPLQLSLQIWRLLLKAMIGYCSQKTVDGLRYLYRTFFDSITTEQESTSTNDLPRSSTTIGIRVCDYLRQMTQMLRFRMYEDQLQLVFTPIVREVNDDLNRSIIEFGLRVCDYLRRHLVPFVVTYDRDQRQFVLTIRVEELKYLYQPAIQVGVNVDNDLPRSITTIGVRVCDYLPRSSTTIGIRVWDYLRHMIQMLQFRRFEDQLQLVFTPIVREVDGDLNRFIIELGFRVCDYLRRHLIPFEVTYDCDQRQFVLAIRVEELKYLYQPALQVGVNVDNDLLRSITTIGVRMCDYPRQMTKTLQCRGYGDDLNRSIIEFGIRDYLNRHLVPFRVTYDHDQHRTVQAIINHNLRDLNRHLVPFRVTYDHDQHRIARADGVHNLEDLRQRARQFGVNVDHIFFTYMCLRQLARPFGVNVDHIFFTYLHQLARKLGVNANDVFSTYLRQLARQFRVNADDVFFTYLRQLARPHEANEEDVPSMISLPNEIPLDKLPHGTLKKSSGFSEISMMDVDHEALRKRKPPGPPPGPPPQLSDSEDEEYDPEKGIEGNIGTDEDDHDHDDEELLSSKSRKIRFVDDDTRDPDEEEKDTRLKFEAPKESSESSSDFDSDTKDRRSRRSWGADERERDKEKRRRDDEDKKKARDSLSDESPGADEKQAQPRLMPPGPPPGAPPEAPPDLPSRLPPD